MISFDLRCRHDHVFEVWFRSSGDYDAQRERGLIMCPTCQDSDVTKAVMAPNIPAKGNRNPAGQTAVVPTTDVSGQVAHAASLAAHRRPMPAELTAALAKVAQIQAEMLPQSRWVGRNFAAEARALHAASEQDGGDGPPHAIHGQASVEEAEALADDGIAVMPLLVPIVPPDAQN